MMISKKKRRVDEWALYGCMVIHIQRIDDARAGEQGGQQAGQGVRGRSMHLSGMICRPVAVDVAVWACRERAQLMMPYLAPTRRWCGGRYARHVTLLRVPTCLIVDLVVTEGVVDVIRSEAGLLCLLWLSAA